MQDRPVPRCDLDMPQTEPKRPSDSRARISRRSSSSEDAGVIASLLSKASRTESGSRRSCIGARLPTPRSMRRESAPRIPSRPERPSASELLSRSLRNRRRSPRRLSRPTYAQDDPAEAAPSQGVLESRDEGWAGSSETSRRLQCDTPDSPGSRRQEASTRKAGVQASEKLTLSPSRVCPVRDSQSLRPGRLSFKARQSPWHGTWNRSLCPLGI